MKQARYALFSILFIVSVISNGCVSDTSLPSDMVNAKIPEVVTKDNISSTASSVTIFAEVVKENGMPVTERGAYWSYDSPVDMENDEKVSEGKGKGEFSVTIENLKNDITYYITPYAVNRKGIALGTEVVVNTKTGLGVVMTLAPVDSTATTARIGGKIIQQGEGETIERGVYLSANPGFKDPERIIKSDMPTDSFMAKVIDLTPNTQYYFKAFVKNTYGVFIGQEMSFKTTLGIPVVGDIKAVKIDFYKAEFQSEVISEGDSPVTDRGFCWKENEMPTIDDDTLNCSSGKGIFQGKIENLFQNVKYYVRAYAINSFGVSYSKDTVFSPLSDSPTVVISKDNLMGVGFIDIKAEVSDEGLTSVVESGLCWSTSNQLPDTMDNKMALSSGRDSFEGRIEKLKGETTYYVRAYGTNELKTQYSEVYSFTTPSMIGNVTALNKIRTQGTTRFCNSAYRGFLLGGDAGSEYTNELWRYDADVDKWYGRQAYPEKNISGQTPVYLNEKMYVFGGKKEGEPVNDFYSYSDYKNEWESISTTSGPAAASLAAGCVLDQAIYYIGGQQKSTFISEVWKFNPAEKEWGKIGDLPESQYGGIALVVDNAIYAGLGLNNMSGSSTNKKLWASSDGGNTWNEKATIPDEASQVIGGVVFREKLYIIDNNAQIWNYSIEGNEWKKKSKLAILDKNVHCIYVLNNKIYLGFGSRSDQFFTYEPDWDN